MPAEQFAYHGSQYSVLSVADHDPLSQYPGGRTVIHPVRVTTGSMTVAQQAWPADPITIAVIALVAAIVLFGLVVLRIRRSDGVDPPDSEPMRADAPRGRICPDCNEVNPMDAATCEECGRSFTEAAPADE